MNITSSPPSSSSSSCWSHFWSSALRSKHVVTPAEKAARDNSKRGLTRRLGPFDLILLGIGASIGAGIFVVTGTVARTSGPGMYRILTLTQQNFYSRKLIERGNIHLVCPIKPGTIILHHAYKLYVCFFFFFDKMIITWL